MQRRDLLTRLGLALGFLGVAERGQASDEYSQNDVYTNIHPDYIIWWTGWKSDHESFHFYSQWVACPKDENDPIRYYASFPGQQGYFECMEHFDLYHREDQWEIVPPFGEKAEKAKKECFNRLLQEIRNRERPEWAK